MSKIATQLTAKTFTKVKYSCRHGRCQLRNKTAFNYWMMADSVFQVYHEVPAHKVNVESEYFWAILFLSILILNGILKRIDFCLKCHKPLGEQTFSFFFVSHAECFSVLIVLRNNPNNKEKRDSIIYTFYSFVLLNEYLIRSCERIFKRDLFLNVKGDIFHPKYERYNLSVLTFNL